MADGWGVYVVCRDGTPFIEEWTNFGVALYRRGVDGGGLIAARFDTPDRAVRRGSIPPDRADSVAWYAREFAERYPNLSAVLVALKSDGHGMSRLQLTPPRGTVLEANTIDEIFGEFVPTA